MAYSDMDRLPVEILHIIAADSEGAYRAMLAVPLFARSIDVSLKYDFMIGFGHSVRVTKFEIKWTRYGLEHRLDGPSYESENTIIWCKNDILHRHGGPALIESRGSWTYIDYFKDGVNHCEDGPASIWACGDKRTRIWRQNGLIHCETGPAYIEDGQPPEYWLHGVEYNWPLVWLFIKLRWWVLSAV